MDFFNEKNLVQISGKIPRHIEVSDSEKNLVNLQAFTRNTFFFVRRCQFAQKGLVTVWLQHRQQTSGKQMLYNVGISTHARETLLELWWLDGYSEVNLGDYGWMRLMILTIHGLIKNNASSNQVFRHLPKATKKDIVLDSLCKTLH